jgi:hypothetical protein
MAQELEISEFEQSASLTGSDLEINIIWPFDNLIVADQYLTTTIDVTINHATVVGFDPGNGSWVRFLTSNVSDSYSSVSGFISGDFFLVAKDFSLVYAIDLSIDFAAVNLQSFTDMTSLGELSIETSEITNNLNVLPNSMSKVYISADRFTDPSAEDPGSSYTAISITTQDTTTFLYNTGRSWSDTLEELTLKLSESTSATAITGDVVDDILIDISNSGTTPTGAGILYFGSGCELRTAASDAAYSDLTTKGFTITNTGI